MKLITEILKPRHRKKEFSCGKDILDKYLHQQANQDIKRKLSVCFVLTDLKTDAIKGYYTLSNNSISQDVIPSSLRKKLPKFLLFNPSDITRTISHRYKISRQRNR